MQFSFSHLFHIPFLSSQYGHFDTYPRLHNLIEEGISEIPVSDDEIYNTTITSVPQAYTIEGCECRSDKERYSASVTHQRGQQLGQGDLVRHNGDTKGQRAVGRIMNEQGWDDSANFQQRMHYMMGAAPAVPFPSSPVVPAKNSNHSGLTSATRAEAQSDRSWKQLTKNLKTRLEQGKINSAVVASSFEIQQTYPGKQERATGVQEDNKITKYTESSIHYEVSDENCKPSLNPSKASAEQGNTGRAIKAPIEGQETHLSEPNPSKNNAIKTYLMGTIPVTSRDSSTSNPPSILPRITKTTKGTAIGGIELFPPDGCNDTHFQIDMQENLAKRLLNHKLRSPRPHNQGRGEQHRIHYPALVSSQFSNSISSPAKHVPLSENLSKSTLSINVGSIPEKVTENQECSVARGTEDISEEVLLCASLIENLTKENSQASKYLAHPMEALSQIQRNDNRSDNSSSFSSTLGPAFDSSFMEAGKRYGDTVARISKHTEAADDFSKGIISCTSLIENLVKSDSQAFKYPAYRVERLSSFHRDGNSSDSLPKFSSTISAVFNSVPMKGTAVQENTVPRAPEVVKNREDILENLILNTTPTHVLANDFQQLKHFSHRTGAPSQIQEKNPSANAPSNIQKTISSTTFPSDSWGIAETQVNMAAAMSDGETNISEETMSCPSLIENLANKDPQVFKGSPYGALRRNKTQSKRKSFNKPSNVSSRATPNAQKPSFLLPAEEIHAAPGKEILKEAQTRHLLKEEYALVGHVTKNRILPLPSSEMDERQSTTSIAIPETIPTQFGVLKILSSPASFVPAGLSLTKLPPISIKTAVNDPDLGAVHPKDANSTVPCSCMHIYPILERLIDFQAERASKSAVKFESSVAPQLTFSNILCISVEPTVIKTTGGQTSFHRDQALRQIDSGFPELPSSPGLSNDLHNQEGREQRLSISQPTIFNQTEDPDYSPDAFRYLQESFAGNFGRCRADTHNSITSDSALGSSIFTSDSPPPLSNSTQTLSLGHLPDPIGLGIFDIVDPNPTLIAPIPQVPYSGEEYIAQLERALLRSNPFEENRESFAVNDEGYEGGKNIDNQDGEFAIFNMGLGHEGDQKLFGNVDDEGNDSGLEAGSAPQSPVDSIQCQRTLTESPEPTGKEAKRHDAWEEFPGHIEMGTPLEPAEHESEPAAIVDEISAVGESQASSLRQDPQENCEPTPRNHHPAFLNRPPFVKQVSAAYTTAFLKEDLNEFIKRQHLHKFYPEDHPFLAQIAEKGTQLISGGEDPEYICALMRISLYETIVLCDDSGSMVLEDRIPTLKDALHRLTEIVTTFEEGSGLSVRWINTSTIKNLMNGIKFRELLVPMFQKIQFCGGTLLGKQLHTKVLKPFVIRKMKEGLKKPVLVTIITDGEPDDTKELVQNIRQVKFDLRIRKYEESAVAFHITQVGQCITASVFLDELAQDEDVSKHIYCTEQRLDVRSPLFEHSGDYNRWWAKELLTAIDPNHNWMSS